MSPIEQQLNNISDAISSIGSSSSIISSIDNLTSHINTTNNLLIILILLYAFNTFQRYKNKK